MTNGPIVACRDGRDKLCWSAVQRGPQSGQTTLSGLGGRRDHTGVPEITVHQCFGIVQVHRYTGVREQLGVADTVVAQRVVAGDRDVGRRETRQVGGVAWRQARGRVVRVEVAGIPAGERGDRGIVENRGVGVLGGLAVVALTAAL